MNPLIDKSRREYNECSLNKVRYDESNDLNGLTKTHFITYESTFADLLSAERGNMLCLDGMFPS